MPDGSGLVSAVLPFTAVRKVMAGEASDSGFHDFYVELTVQDGAKPRWRLLRGENPELAAEVTRALVEAGMSAAT